MDYSWISEIYDDNEKTISDERLAILIKRFNPLVMRGNELYTIDIPDLRNRSFTWDPVLIEKVSFQKIISVTTSHSCGYHGLFKPSIAEVLAYVPDNTEWGNAFYIDPDFVEIYKCGGGHRATTHFGII